MTTPPYRLARVVQTCRACPSQWDAWTTTGQYLYLRYRWGIGTVEAYPGPDGEAWDEPKTIAEFRRPSRLRLPPRAAPTRPYSAH